MCCSDRDTNRLFSTCAHFIPDLLQGMVRFLCLGLTSNAKEQHGAREPGGDLSMLILLSRETMIRQRSRRLRR